ncbi:MAG: SCO family protein [Gaiellales bacterium]
MISLSIALATVSAVLILAVVFFGGSTAGSTYRGTRPPAEISLPAFTLVDETGAQVRSEDVARKVVVVTFLDAQCTDACPVAAGIIARAVDDLTAEERADVAVLGFSVDPAEDTRAAVTSFLDRHRARGRIRYLTAPQQVMEPLWDAFKVLPTVRSGDDSLHSIPIEIYDRDGIWRSTLTVGVDLTNRNLAHDVRVALRR